MVITAARTDRSSFGCGTKSEITDFGRAFFVEGLNHNDSFGGAFTEAKGLIQQWEDRDHETHSEPQFITTPQIDAKLQQWRAGLKLGAAVPFGENAGKPHSTPSSLPAKR
jgi:Peptidase C13 family